MSDDDLPGGWVEASLGEIIAPSKEKIEPSESPNCRYLSLEHVESKTARIIGSGNGADVESTKAVFHAGDVLYGKLRPYLNKVCIPDFDGICSTDILVFPNSPSVENRFLMRFLMQPEVVEYANHNSNGIQLPRISFDKLAELPFKLPPSAEQKRIVAKVEALLARVNAARQRLTKVPAILKRFRQSILAAACSGRLTADWREEHPDVGTGAAIVAELEGAHDAAGGHKQGNAAMPTYEAHDLDPGTLPAWWAMTHLRTAVCPDRPITYGILKPGPDIPGGVPYIRVADFPNDRLNVSAVKRTTEEIDRAYARARLRERDILLSIRGTVGRVCFVPKALHNANITQDTARLSIQSTLDSDFVVWFLRAYPTQKRMQRALKGVAVRGINIGDVRALQIPIPPREEQHEIVRRVEALFALADTIEKRVAAVTARAEKLTQAILAKAFRGELVPTEAELARREGRDYEPASVLLERIRAERPSPCPERHNSSRVISKKNARRAKKA